MNWFIYGTRKKMTSLREMWFYHKSGSVIGMGTVIMPTC